MKITINAKELLNTLKKLKMIKPQAPGLPIIECVKISAVHENIIISFTNLDIWVETNVDGIIEETGNVLINFDRISKLLAGKTKSVEIIGENSEVYISFEDGFVWKPAGDDHRFLVDDYPSFPNSGPAVSAENILAENFIPILTRCNYATLKVDSRFNLNAICLKNGDVIGTDGHRLEKASLDVFLDKTIMLPNKTVSFIGQKGFLKGQLSLSLYEKWFGVFDEKTTVMSSLIEEDYPDYTRVIPEGSPTKIVTTNRKQLISALRIFLSLVTKNNPGVNITLNSGVGIELKENEMFVAGKVSSPEVMTFIINRQYFEDALKVSSQEDVEIQYFKQGDPIIIFADDQYSLVMPMRK